jgi:hypothetical protein
MSVSSSLDSEDEGSHPMVRDAGAVQMFQEPVQYHAIALLTIRLRSSADDDLAW